MFSKGSGRPYFGLTGKWLTFWVTVACATDMVGSYDRFSNLQLTYK